MLTFVNILFRLKALHWQFGFPGAVHVKYYIMTTGYALEWVFRGIVFLCTWSVYTQCIIAAGFIVQSYDLLDDGFVDQVHQSGVFATWRGAARFAILCVYTLIGLIFMAPPFPL